MNNKPIFNWDAEQRIASCVLSTGTKVFSGIAQCHPDDEDMMSEKTGCEIAFRRAKIDLLRDYRNEIEIKLSALNQLYYSMNQSKKFDNKSYEYKMLKRQINMYKFDLETVKEQIQQEQDSLREYIENKGKFYTHIRTNRQKAKTD